MATNKDPSIFEERSTIGSIDELDEYGVWIKSEPKDIEDMKTLSGTGPNDEGQLEEDVESIKKGGSSLSEHESLDVFEPSIPDIEDLPDLDIDVNEPFPELAEEGSREQNVSEAQKESELPEIEGLSFEVEEIEGFPSSEPPVSREKEVPPSETKEAEQIQRVLEPLPDMDIEENVSFEEVTSDEKQDTTDESLMVAEENTSDFTELSMEDFLGEDSETGIPASPTVEEEPLNIDLEFTDETEGVETVSIDSVSSLASPVVSETSADLQLETVSDFDDLLSDLQKEETSEKEETDLSSTAPEVSPAALKGDMLEQSKEISSEKLSSEPEAGLVQREEGVSNKGEGSDLSTQLLMKIAEEIASIKNELATLKEELSHFKGSSESHHEEKEKESGPRGFFEEEEDEKIALTGDELDNILNTAEFTEETGSGIPESDLLEETEQSQEVLFEEKGDLKEESTETAGIVEEPFSVSSLSEPSAFEKIESEELVTDDEIKNLMEEGVTPLSSPPEDTSYLEEDLVSSEPLFEESLPDIEMGDIVLEEPPLEEPAIESIKLELEEGEKEPSVVDEFVAPQDLVEEENIQEIKLHDEILDEENSFDLEDLGTELPVSEESFAEVVPENFVVAPEEETSTGGPSFPEVAEEVQTIPELDNLDVEEDILTETEISEPETEEQESSIEAVGSAPGSTAPSVTSNLPPDLTEEIKAVLSYMDQLLESLPEEKIEEFARSEYFVTYKKLFEELGLV